MGKRGREMVNGMVKFVAEGEVCERGREIVDGVVKERVEKEGRRRKTIFHLNGGRNGHAVIFDMFGEAGF